MGFKAFYGDATRIDILKAAGADRARILIAAIGEPDINHDLVQKAQKLFPHLTIMARAKNNGDAYEFMDAGIRDIYRETLDTSVRLGVDALVKLGFRRYSATRAGQNFLKYDAATLQKLAAHRHDERSYIHNVRKEVEVQEQLLTSDREFNPALDDHAWDVDSFKERDGEGEAPG